MRAFAALAFAGALLAAGSAAAEMRAVEVIKGGPATIQFENTLWQAGRVPGKEGVGFQCISDDCGGKETICNAVAYTPPPGEHVNAETLIQAMREAIDAGNALIPGVTLVSVTEPPRSAMMGDNMGALVSLVAEQKSQAYEVDMFHTGGDGKTVYSVTCLAPAGSPGAWERQMLIGGLKVQ
jgi:hypothetical protein